MENKKDAGAEAISPCPKNHWRIYLDRCTLCGECIDACPSKLLSIKDKMIDLEEGCSECGDCAAACGQYAITFI